MQSNQITLGKTVYERFKEYPDRTVYNANDHSIAHPHLLTFSRVELATPGSSVKSRVKFTIRATNADGTKTGDVIVTTDFSFPQWVGAATVENQVAQLALFLASAEAKELFLKQSI